MGKACPDPRNPLQHQGNLQVVMVPTTLGRSTVVFWTGLERCECRHQHPLTRTQQGAGKRWARRLMSSLFFSPFQHLRCPCPCALNRRVSLAAAAGQRAGSPRPRLKTKRFSATAACPPSSSRSCACGTLRGCGSRLSHIAGALRLAAQPRAAAEHGPARCAPRTPSPAQAALGHAAEHTGNKEY